MPPSHHTIDAQEASKNELVQGIDDNKDQGAGSYRAYGQGHTTASKSSVVLDHAARMEGHPPQFSTTMPDHLHTGSHQIHNTQPLMMTTLTETTIMSLLL